MTDAPTLPRRALAAGVGLFALWQLVFLPAANLIDFVPRRLPAGDDLTVTDPYQAEGTFTSVEPLQRVAERVGDVLDFWSEASGQDQGWRLFAPGNPPHTLFPAVELRFPDGEVVEIRSRYEPADFTNPVSRAPLVHNRFFNFESQFTNPGWYCSAESLARYPDMWSEGLPESVRVSHRHLVAWLRWHADQYRAANPGRGMPAEVVLKYRYIPTPLPGEPRGWTKPVTERPYARWKPAEAPEPGCLPVEGYDPVNSRYVRLKGEATR